MAVALDEVDGTTTTALDTVAEGCTTVARSSSSSSSSSSAFIVGKVDGWEDCSRTGRPPIERCAMRTTHYKVVPQEAEVLQHPLLSESQLDCRLARFGVLDELPIDGSLALEPHSDGLA